MNQHSMQGKQRNCVIFNVFGHLNSGDALLLETLIEHLARFSPNDNLSGIAFAPAVQQQWMPNLEWAERPGNTITQANIGRIHQWFTLVILALIAFSPLFLFLEFLLPKGQRRALHMLREADLAISCPGGYLEDSNSAYVINALNILLASRLSKTTVLAPQSIGPVSNRFGRFLIRHALKASDRIFIRENKSLEFAKSVLGPADTETLKKIDLSGDLAFWFDPGPHVTGLAERRRLGLDDNRKLLGLTVVDWNFPNVPERAAARARYIASISALIRHVEAMGTHQIVIFNQVASDLNLAREIGKLHPSVMIDTLERGAADFCKLIGSADAFIGTRFHSCIFAMLESVPTIAIAYLPKTTGVMDDLGLSDLVIDINQVTGQTLIDCFERVTAERTELSQKISRQLEIYRARHDQFLVFLRSASPEQGKSIELLEPRAV